MLVDDKGNHLVKTAYGITGWTQARENPAAGNENFPPLKTIQDDIASLHYNPELGTVQDEHYYPKGAAHNAAAVAGKPAPDAANSGIYHRLLATALTPGGVRFNVDCTAGTAYADEEALPYCQLHETSDALPPKRPDGIATGTETTLPGNGCLYFHNNNSNDDYAYNFRTLEKQCPTADNSALEEVAQPMYALGGEATYAGMRAAGDEVEETIHNKPLPLYDRIDGEKAIAEIAASSRIKPHQAAACQRTKLRKQRPRRRMRQLLAAGTKRRWHHRLDDLRHHRQRLHWQIELLFKWMKQHLALERPYSRTENGVKLHIVCVLIAYLLLRQAHREAGETMSLHLYLAKISTSLFERPETAYAHYRRRRERCSCAAQEELPLF